MAALNHPNICTLARRRPQLSGDGTDRRATLAERIKEGPMPLAEALGIADRLRMLWKRRTKRASCIAT